MEHESLLGQAGSFPTDVRILRQVGKSLMVALQKRRAESQERKAGAAQGLLILAASALPVMGVVLLSPIAQRLPAAVGTGPGGISLAPFVLTAPALAIAVLSPVGGYLLDVVGRRICFLSALLIYAAVGTAPLWLENAYVIVLARFALGATEAVILASTIALIGDYFSGATRDKWVAYMMAVAALAATLFYIAGGMLGSISWRAPFAAYGVSALIFLAAIPIIFEPDPSTRRQKTVVTKEHAANTPRLAWEMIALFAATFIGSILFYIVPLQLGVFLAERGVESPAQIGLLIAIAGLGNPIGSFSFRFLRNLSFSTLLGASSALAGLGLLLAALWKDVPMLVSGAFINQLGCGILCPLTMAATLRLAPAHRRGTSGGGWSTAFFVGQFFSPLAVLPVISLDTRSNGLLPLAGLNLLFACVSYWLFSRLTSLNAESDGTPCSVELT